ncbi:MAG: ABC transporter substrate-binding protein [Rhodothermales bacterium]
MRRPHCRIYCLFLFGLLLVFGFVGRDVQAQGSRVIDRIPAADSVLSVGFAAFDASSWQVAFDHFRAVETDYGRNASASTARIMAAKAAFRMGDFDQTRRLLSSYAIDFPGSSYINPARSLEQRAYETASRQPDKTIDIGIMLPLSESVRVPSQQMFNGIRMAVDNHNQDALNLRARMVFQDISGGADEAAATVSRMAEDGIDVIIGTLFSASAIAAAERADEEGIVFIAPMATDERVSDGRRFAFQANPSMQARGRVTGRFAVNGLRLDSLAVLAIADERGITERLADGFIQGATENGAAINLIQIAGSQSEFLSLPDTLAADTLSIVEAVYIPMASRNTAEEAGRVLGMFDRWNRGMRILGNTAWHDLPQRSHASRYQLTYSNDFFPDLNSVPYLQFGWGYYDLSGEEVGRLGVTGYDVTRFVLDILNGMDSRTLVDRIRNAPPFQGFGIRMAFNGGNVNEGLFYHRYRDGRLDLIR